MGSELIVALIVVEDVGDEGVDEGDDVNDNDDFLGDEPPEELDTSAYDDLNDANLGKPLLYAGS